MAKAYNLAEYNRSLKEGKRYYYIGKNGVEYEYILHYGTDSDRPWEDAIDVQSRKRITKYDNGKRPGQFQPVGAKRNFTFYQTKELRTNERIKLEYLHLIKEILEQLYGS